MSFSNWLQNAGLNTSTIESLQNSDYNSINVLKECRNDDINEIAASLNIQTLQKLKLKSALRQLHENESNRHKMISNKEQNAILDLTKLSNKLEEYINDINIETNDYNKELSKFEKRIDNEFDLLFKELTKKKKIIKEKLYKIVNDKIKTFDSKKLKYEKKIEEINKTKTKCHQLLNDAIEIEKLDERKQKICKMTKTIMKNNKNNKSNIPYYKPSQKIHFFDILSFKTLDSIRNLDIITKCIIYPKLLLLTNSGKNHIILLKWYINQKTDEQIKIEWVKISQECFLNNEDEKNDYDWNYKLTKNGNMEFRINVKQNGKYLCRISYFDIYLKENLMSNTISISITCDVLWDVLHSGNDVNFIGNKAKLLVDCWRTLIGKEIINVINVNKNKDKYHYRLKIHHACDKGGGFMIGIIPNKNINVNMARSFTRYGGFAINKGGLLFPGGRRYTNVTWRDGDIVDIYINIKLLTLSFAYNGINLGVAFKNLPKQKYRFALTLLYQDDEIELIETK
eukprot:313167_1